MKLASLYRYCCAVRMGRRGVGFELKPSYFGQAVRNLLDAKRRNDDAPLFAEVAAE